jgi:excinuclease ABC subunit B
MSDIAATVAKGERVLVTTLTKKMAEQLTEYLQEAGIRVAYIHSDVDTLERTEVLRDLRLGVYDVLVGINLLREGIDLPEVSLVAILDADKEGFLRSTTSLIQTIGRAARHQAGRAVLYADVMTNSLKAAIGETARRRTLQTDHNKAHGITPTTIQKAVRQHLEQAADDGTEKKGKAPRRKVAATLPDTDDVAALRKDMLKAAEELDFERAAALRDRIRALEGAYIGIKAPRG